MVDGWVIGHIDNNDCVWGRFVSLDDSEFHTRAEQTLKIFRWNTIDQEFKATIRDMLGQHLTEDERYIICIWLEQHGYKEVI